MALLKNYKDFHPGIFVSRGKLAIFLDTEKCLLKFFFYKNSLETVDPRVRNIEYLLAV